MTIKETEEKIGLARSHIRFYEKEKRIHPARNNVTECFPLTRKLIMKIWR